MRLQKIGASPLSARSLMTFALMFGGVAMARAGVEWHVVDPLSEFRFMPEKAPRDGVRGGTVRIVSAQDEYEPCSFVLCSDADIAKVQLSVNDLKTEAGDSFPVQDLDFKTVKVWYQNMNAWFSYFQDRGLKLCPELLLNDEDLVRVDTRKRANYARLAEKDGTIRYHWLTPPRDVENRTEDAGNVRVGDAFLAMKPNFCDAETFQGARLEAGKFKQFFLTAHVRKGTRPGVYRGNIRMMTDGRILGVIPLELTVLDFVLPEPATYFDLGKEYRVWFCDYSSIESIMLANGGDRELARRQLIAICRDFRRHNQKIPSYHDVLGNIDIARAANMDVDHAMLAAIPNPIPWNKAEVRFAARRAREQCLSALGTDKLECYAQWGDEYTLPTLRGVREMIEIFQEAGFRYPINSQAGYAFGGYFADIFWPPDAPEMRSREMTEKFNSLGGEGYYGWYACQHVGCENPAFVRRQYGIGPYRAGFSCSYNYAHHLQGWNDIAPSIYRPMMFVYGCGNGCIDTLQWEAFREALDDIRYATKLQQLAKPLAGSENVRTRYAARKALQVLANATTEDFDLTTFRLEMIRHIRTLLKVSKQGEGK